MPLARKTISATRLFQTLFRRFGAQGWWPVQSSNRALEVCVGAILTQNAAWTNVEKALKNLISAGMLDLELLARAPQPELAAMIRPSGYFNQKTRRLQLFARHVSDRHGSLRKMFSQDGRVLREELLSLEGIGAETADSMALYAAGKPFFVIDAYTRRICSRLGLCEEAVSYGDLQRFFHSQVRPDPVLYNEFHALFVILAKEHCKKRTPLCGTCPLWRQCPSFAP